MWNKNQAGLRWEETLRQSTAEGCWSGSPAGQERVSFCPREGQGREPSGHPEAGLGHFRGLRDREKLHLGLLQSDPQHCAAVGQWGQAVQPVFCEAKNGNLEGFVVGPWEICDPL